MGRDGSVLLLSIGPPALNTCALGASGAAALACEAQAHQLNLERRVQTLSLQLAQTNALLHTAGRGGVRWPTAAALRGTASSSSSSSGVGRGTPVKVRYAPVQGPRAAEDVEVVGLRRQLRRAEEEAASGRR